MIKKQAKLFKWLLDRNLTFILLMIPSFVIPIFGNVRLVETWLALLVVLLPYGVYLLGVYYKLPPEERNR